MFLLTEQESEVIKMQGLPSKERHTFSMNHTPILREVNPKIHAPNAEFSN